MTLILLWLILLFIIQFSSVLSIKTIEYHDYDRGYNVKKYEFRRDFREKRKIVQFTCLNPSIDCSNHGKCDNNNLIICQCDKRYYTPPGSYIQCTYYQKSKTVSILLECFIGFGFGHLYNENYTVFILKFLFFFLGCYFNICITLFIGSSIQSNCNEDINQYSRISMIVLLVLMVIWYLIDIILLSIGVYKDGNGIELY